ncbi:SIMPL domain-containing protein [Candidatus Gracilibacteria bacterium]|nr:SIMPL domain-containing protein [Candidatus Gracilibacteria bacterium]
MKKEQMWFMIAVAVIVGAFIFMGYQMKVPYKNQLPSQQGITNTISVNGEGKAYTSSDTFVINAMISEIGKTTKEAQTLMETKILKIKEILANNEIKKENVKTNSINVYTEYDWSNSQRKLIGYRAEQSLEIEVSGEGYAEKGASIINQLADVGGININNTYFILKEKDKAVEEAREKAFENAKAKAEQLAKLGNLQLGKPTMITDNEVSNFPGPYPYLEYAKADSAMGMGGAEMNSEIVSPGQSEVTVYLQIVYEVK